LPTLAERLVDELGRDARLLELKHLFRHQATFALDLRDGEQRARDLLRRGADALQVGAHLDELLRLPDLELSG